MQPEKSLDVLVAEHVFNMPVEFDKYPILPEYCVVRDYSTNPEHIFAILTALSQIPNIYCSLFIRHDQHRKEKQWTVMVGDNGRIDCDYEDIPRVICERAVEIVRSRKRSV